MIKCLCPEGGRKANKNFVPLYQQKKLPMKKHSLVQIVNELPYEFNLDDLLEKIVVLEKIEK